MWCSPMTVLFDWTTNWFGFVCVCVSVKWEWMNEYIYIRVHCLSIWCLRLRRLHQHHRHHCMLNDRSSEYWWWWWNTTLESRCGECVWFVWHILLSEWGNFTIPQRTIAIRVHSHCISVNVCMYCVCVRAEMTLLLLSIELFDSHYRSMMMMMNSILSLSLSLM